MSAVVCPHCNVTFSQEEVADGWCEGCGKKIPDYVLKEAFGSSYTPTRPTGRRQEPPALSSEGQYSETRQGRERGYLDDSAEYPPRYYDDRRLTYPSRAPLASRLSRLAAAILDAVFAAMLYLPGYLMVLSQEDRGERADPETVFLGLALLLGGVLVLLITQVWMLSVSGQTVGKRVVGVRIVRLEDDSNPGFVGAFLLRAFVPGLIGAIPCIGPLFSIADILFIFSDDRRCLHDRIAGTKVVVA